MDFQQDEPGYIESDGIEVKISEPRGDWSHPHVDVAIHCGDHRSVNVIQGPLTPDTIAELKGTKKGIGTCAAVYSLIEQAADDIDFNIEQDNP